MDDHAMNDHGSSHDTGGSPERRRDRSRRIGRRVSSRRPSARLQGRRMHRTVAACLGALALASFGVLALPSVAGASSGRSAGSFTPFLDTLHTVVNVASTVPRNGDVNPYGIVTVPDSVGKLVKNDTLISNFNAKSNLQGTGTTIVQISRSGHRSLFARLHGALPGACPGGIGLTTALTILQGGYVVVGSLPVTDGGSGTPEAGCLIVLERGGRARRDVVRLTHKRPVGPHIRRGARIRRDLRDQRLERNRARATRTSWTREPWSVS